MSYNQTPYDLSDPEPSGGKKRKKKGGSVVKVWLVEGLPRYLITFIAVWIVVLFHTIFTEAGEYQGEILGSDGKTAFMQVQGAQASIQEHLWTRPYDGRAILAGDWFRTGPGSTITLAFYERSLVRINSSSGVRLAECAFERSNGGRMRLLQVNNGSVYVRSATPVSAESEFTIRTSQATISGWNAFYYADPSRVEVGQGTVTVTGKGKTLELNAGQGIDLGTMTVREQSQAAKQGLAQVGPKLPEPETTDKARLFVVNLEERIVLANSEFILKMFGHKSGEGNPFRGFSLVNSSRRTQCQQRLADLHESMQSLGNAPASIRLDDFAALGVNEERLKLLRQAFYRGQLMSYQASTGAWKITARANDREHTLLTMTQDGVSGYKKAVAE